MKLRPSFVITLTGLLINFSTYCAIEVIWNLLIINNIERNKVNNLKVNIKKEIDINERVYTYFKTNSLIIVTVCKVLYAEEVNL